MGLWKPALPQTYGLVATKVEDLLRGLGVLGFGVLGFLYRFWDSVPGLEFRLQDKD